eukprot:1192414-Prorocentrum_minimum.AAC.3
MSMKGRRSDSIPARNFDIYKLRAQPHAPLRLRRYLGVDSWSRGRQENGLERKRYCERAANVSNLTKFTYVIRLYAHMYH